MNQHSLFVSLTLSFATVISSAQAGSYAEIQSFMKKLATTYPTTTRLFDVAKSDSGLVIQGLAIGSGNLKNLVVATHHGNEYGSTEVARGFASSLAVNPIPGQTIFIIPVLNISGYNENSRVETAGKQYYDPNRDYPGPCGTEGPFHLKSTAALAQFVDKENIVASATLHTFYPAVLYPWGVSTRDTQTPYDEQFISLGHLATQDSGYAVGNSTELLYPADGTFEDYAFWKHGIWSLLFEMGSSHTPGSAELKKMVEVNVTGLRHMFEQVPSQRAVNHAFTGHCDTSLLSLDRHDE